MDKINLLSRIKLAIVMCIGGAFLLSCEDKDGEATPPGFPLEEKIVDSQAQEIVLKAKNNVEWFLTDFIINGEVIRGDAWESEDIVYYTSQEQDPKNKHNHLLSIYKIEYDWFIWEKLDNKTIKIILTKNEEHEQRTLNFSASVGNAQDNIKITQKANSLHNQNSESFPTSSAGSGAELPLEFPNQYRRHMLYSEMKRVSSLYKIFDSSQIS